MKLPKICGCWFLLYETAILSLKFRGESSPLLELVAGLFTLAANPMTERRRRQIRLATICGTGFVGERPEHSKTQRHETTYGDSTEQIRTGDETALPKTAHLDVTKLPLENSPHLTRAPNVTTLLM